MLYLIKAKECSSGVSRIHVEYERPLLMKMISTFVVSIIRPWSKRRLEDNRLWYANEGKVG